MRFGAHYLPTYVPDLDGSPADFYRNMFEQIEALDALGFDDVWMTEHHFDEYGGTVPDPATFLAAAAARTTRIHLGVAYHKNVSVTGTTLELTTGRRPVDWYTRKELEEAVQSAL